MWGKVQAIESLHAEDTCPKQVFEDCKSTHIGEPYLKASSVVSSSPEGGAAGAFWIRRARDAYCSVDSVSAASAPAGDTHATMTVCESPPSESCA